jgi:hypothetical protein
MHMLHMLFVDFRQAFDSINRKRLYEAMEWMKMSDKLIRLTRMTMNTTHAKLKQIINYVQNLNLIPELIKGMVYQLPYS